jgi:hypothetical protein
MRFSFSCRRRQCGTAAVELALVLPLLLLLMFITTELGRAVYHYGVLTQSVRKAVRHLSMQTPGEGVEAARNLVMYGNVQGSGVAVLQGLGAEQVESVWQTVGLAPPMSVVTVRVRAYRYGGLILPLGGYGFGPLVFADISATMRVLP